MIHDYYKQKHLIARVDRDGNIIGKVEKWEAHKKGILHKGLTVALIYNNQFILQHRKHPAFDGVLDITSSSHQLFSGDKLQTTLEAVFYCLKREWNLDEKDLIGNPKNLGSVYYKAKDTKSVYTEHEVCDIFSVEVKKKPTPNYDFAYGFSLVVKTDLKNKRIFDDLAPWVKRATEDNKL